MSLNSMHRNTREEVMEVAKESHLSRNNLPRFELRVNFKGDLIRATHGRNLTRNPFHPNTKVKRLMELIIERICNNIHEYDLQNFSEVFIVEDIMRRLSRKGRLNNKSLRSLLGPSVEGLDLRGCLLTNVSLTLIAQRCPKLRWINLYNQSYFVTDSSLARLLKSTPSLESINLGGCHHLTNRAIDSLLRFTGTSLKSIVVTNIPSIDQAALLRLLTETTVLRHINIGYRSDISPEYREKMAAVASDHGFKLVLRHIEDVTIRKIPAVDVSLDSLAAQAAID